MQGLGDGHQSCHYSDRSECNTELVGTAFSCSGQVAVITPRQVITGLGGKQVRAVAAAKHHTVIATEGGEVYTWGSNRGEAQDLIRTFVRVADIRLSGR
jgi:alpha-tubulin suppressor-like RCC1 family protein